MARYTLIFAESGQEQEKVVEFEADDPSAALFYAHQEAVNRPADLWCDDRRLCRIRRSPYADTDLWEIIPLPA